MVAVVLVLGWALLLGVTARRFDARTQLALLLGIGAATALQYFVLGAS